MGSMREKAKQGTKLEVISYSLRSHICIKSLNIGMLLVVTFCKREIIPGSVCQPGKKNGRI